MAGISNGSFEIAGSEPGRALGWVFDSVQADWLFAGFDGALPGGAVVVLGFEGFEEDLAGYFFSFSAVDQDPAFGVDVEDFETGWQNEPYFFAFPEVAVSAEFSTVAADRPYEAFENDWQNFPYYTSFGALPSTDAADFDTTPEPFEDFEEDWKSNESYWFDWASVPSKDSAKFDVTPEPFEDFEEDWPTEIASTL